ncbi:MULTISPECIES: hypothetical protein [unclassified Nostoc]|nr:MULTISPECIES: hypothetical protein [unclassified Nostoc]MBD2469326.1 hypothetical protein [Nostoc sp. FACHB-145]
MTSALRQFSQVGKPAHATGSSVVRNSNIKMVRCAARQHTLLATFYV